MEICLILDPLLRRRARYLPIRLVVWGNTVFVWRSLRLGPSPNKATGVLHVPYHDLETSPLHSPTIRTCRDPQAKDVYPALMATIERKNERTGEVSKFDIPKDASG